jgi:hypothetical protein
MRIHLKICVYWCSFVVNLKKQSQFYLAPRFIWGLKTQFGKNKANPSGKNCRTGLYRIEYSVSPVRDALRRSPKDCVMRIAKRYLKKQSQFGYFTAENAGCAEVFDV